MNKIKKLKVLLGMVKAEFATALLADGSEISFDALEINREVYDSEGNPLKEGTYTLEDGTQIEVDENGVIKEIEKADGETEKEEVVTTMAEEEGKPKAEGDGKPETTETTEGEKEGKTDEVAVITLDDGKQVKVKVTEGAKVSSPIADGTYTDDKGEYEIDIEKNIVKGYRSTKSAEPVEEVTTDEVVIEKKELEDRVKDLESKVDEIYNLLLQISEREREKEERITEIKEEFAAIKANPSASPVFINSTTQDKPLSKIEKLKRLKNQ